VAAAARADWAEVPAVVVEAARGGEIAGVLWVRGRQVLKV
jgi:hypothetical protein